MDARNQRCRFLQSLKTHLTTLDLQGSIQKGLWSAMGQMPHKVPRCSAAWVRAARAGAACKIQLERILALEGRWHTREEEGPRGPAIVRPG